MQDSFFSCQSRIYGLQPPRQIISPANRFEAETLISQSWFKQALGNSSWKEKWTLKSSKEVLLCAINLKFLHLLIILDTVRFFPCLFYSLYLKTRFFHCYWNRPLLNQYKKLVCVSAVWLVVLLCANGKWFQYGS